MAISFTLPTLHNVFSISARVRDYEGSRWFIISFADADGKTEDLTLFFDYLIDPEERLRYMTALAAAINAASPPTAPAAQPTPVDEEIPF